jgi:hypothetical protein
VLHAREVAAHAGPDDGRLLAVDSERPAQPPEMTKAKSPTADAPAVALGLRDRLRQHHPHAGRHQRRHGSGGGGRSGGAAELLAVLRRRDRAVRARRGDYSVGGGGTRDRLRRRAARRFLGPREHRSRLPPGHRVGARAAGGARLGWRRTRDESPDPARARPRHSWHHRCAIPGGGVPLNRLHC